MSKFQLFFLFCLFLIGASLENTTALKISPCRVGSCRDIIQPNGDIVESPSFLQSRLDPQPTKISQSRMDPQYTKISEGRKTQAINSMWPNGGVLRITNSKGSSKILVTIPTCLSIKSDDLKKEFEVEGQKKVFTTAQSKRKSYIILIRKYEKKFEVYLDVYTDTRTWKYDTISIPVKDTCDPKNLEIETDNEKDLEIHATFLKGVKAVDAVASEWADWGQCSKPCGTGTQKRTRQIKTPAQGEGDTPDLVEDRECNTQVCAVDAVVSEWEDWGKCSKSCNVGTKKRTREIATPAQGTGKNPDLVETKDCLNKVCVTSCNGKEMVALPNKSGFVRTLNMIMGSHRAEKYVYSHELEAYHSKNAQPGYERQGYMQFDMSEFVDTEVSVVLKLNKIYDDCHHDNFIASHVSSFDFTTGVTRSSITYNQLLNVSISHGIYVHTVDISPLFKDQQRREKKTTLSLRLDGGVCNCKFDEKSVVEVTATGQNAKYEAYSGWSNCERSDLRDKTIGKRCKTRKCLPGLEIGTPCAVTDMIVYETCQLNSS